MTFAILAGAFIAVTNLLFSWSFPSENRAQTSIMVIWFVAAGGYSMLVGRHRDVTYLEALRRGAVDAGRALRRMVMR
jgi:hypothetical protein